MTHILVTQVKRVDNGSHLTVEELPMVVKIADIGYVNAASGSESGSYVNLNTQGRTALHVKESATLVYQMMSEHFPSYDTCDEVATYSSAKG